MRSAGFDDHTAEYWARQLRLGACIAGGVTLLGALRVAVDWPGERRWWAAALVLAALAQAVTVRLPWARLVRSAAFRRWLLLWWVAELPVLWLFARYDHDGLMTYLPGAALLLVTLAALYGPGVVVVLGAASVGGFLALLPPVGNGSEAVSVFSLAAITASVAAVCAVVARSRVRLDERRRCVERRTDLLLESSSDAVFAVGADYTVRYASRSVREILGHDPDALRGQPLVALIHPEDLAHAVTWLRDLLTSADGADAAARRTELRMSCAAGGWVYLDVLGRNRLADPDLEAVVVSLRDIGSRRELEEQLSRQAYTDPLTGLPNRALFRARLAEATRNGGAGLLLIDLDDFKLVNDELGHDAGDELLSGLAKRLTRELRPEDTLARLGGDEFAVLMLDADEEAAVALADRLLQAGRRPVRLGSRETCCSLSIGIAGGTRPAEELLRDADLAMYAAKRGGRNRYAVFEPQMARAVMEEAQQRADMERGLAEGQFVVHYQPVVDIKTQIMTGVEALVRWRHPQLGTVLPQSFISAAEANGLIVPLGAYVLRQACVQLRRWLDAHPAARGLRMNINLSARQFEYDGLVADVAAAISAAGIPAANITLEITESMLMENVEQAIDTLAALRRLGVRLAIDDFGTGYSSLSYLKRLPVDIIKIDRAFVAQVDIDADDVALIDAIVGLGQALRLQTVAEGIENDEQASALRKIGCELGQGFLFGRPDTPDAVSAVLARQYGTTAPVRPPVRRPQ